MLYHSPLQISSSSYDAESQEIPLSVRANNLEDSRTTYIVPFIWRLQLQKGWRKIDSHKHGCPCHSTNPLHIFRGILYQFTPNETAEYTRAGSSG